MYTAYIRPKLEYFRTVWIGITKRDQQRLEDINLAAILDVRLAHHIRNSSKKQTYNYAQPNFSYFIHIMRIANVI